MSSTWQDVYQTLKKTGKAGEDPLSTSEKRNITPKLTRHIFEEGQNNPNGKSMLPAIEVVEEVASKLTPGSERRKGVEKALDALRKSAGDQAS